MITCEQARELYVCKDLSTVFKRIEESAGNHQTNCVVCVSTDSVEWIAHKLALKPFSFEVKREKEIGGYTALVISGWAR